MEIRYPCLVTITTVHKINIFFGLLGSEMMNVPSLLLQLIAWDWWIVSFGYFCPLHKGAISCDILLIIIVLVDIKFSC